MKPASVDREWSVHLIEELCLHAARQALGPDASDAEVRLRAEAICDFLYGRLPHPSRALH